MAERLKYIFFTKSSINQLADTIKLYFPEFNKDMFIDLIYVNEWETKELKERMCHTTECLRKTLPDNYKHALDILIKIAPFVKGFEAMALPDFVEQYGMEYWDLSLPALKHFTKYASSEFAIRPFLKQDPQRGITFMSELADDKDEKVRRFASEGCRPRLPWAMALPEFQKNPEPVLNILDKLKNDESEFVRKSVANNLNDISKDHPEIVLDICERWHGQTERTDWIIKHACRSMLKAGNKRALLLFGFADSSDVNVNKLKLEKRSLIIGNDLHFSFQLIVTGEKSSKVRLEYMIHFMKKDGKQSPKVFKITENTYSPGTHPFSRKHSFADMSTRKHYEGEHKITIIVNGEKMADSIFILKK